MERVLVVDDDPQVLSLTTRFLRGAGFDVVASNEFRDARMQMEVCAPSVVVADIRLGGYNGLQLCILARQVREDVGVVIISGYDDVVLQRDIRRIGAEYLPKPFGRADLLAAVERAKARSAALSG
jgi:two-component system OmpR family response regulator